MRELSCLLMTIVLAGGCGVSPSSAIPAIPVSAGNVTGGQIKKPAPPPMDFAGSDICATCHRDIADQYAAHPMGRSSGPLAQVSEIENYGDSAAFISADGKRYVAEHRDSTFFHHEQLFDSDSALLYDQEVAMEFSIGSGRRGRSYAYQRADRFYMSPIGWYTSKERWDLSPGYLPGIHHRFDRVLTERCLGCHTGRMNPGLAPDSWDHERPIVEHAISCERCHGPGASHVKRFQRPETFNGVDRIVNPTDLDPIRRDAVCHQCHFKASKMVTRYGRRSSDFRPGDRMSDVWVVLASPPGERQAVTQSEQMVSSGCYRGSGGRMGCISCHNPHALPTGDPAVAFSRKCAACHSNEDSPCSAPIAEQAGQSCIGCHMPRFEIKEVPHTALTDHRILRRVEKRPTAETSAVSESIFNEGEPKLPDWEIRRAQSLLLRTDRRLARSEFELNRAAATLNGMKDRIADDPELWEMLAWIASRQNRWTEVETLSKKTLELAPERIESRELLLTALSERAAWPELARECKKLIQHDPDKAMYHKRLAEAVWHQGDLEAGMVSAEQSLLCDPTQLDLRRRLAVAYQKLGNSERSIFHNKLLRVLAKPE